MIPQKKESEPFEQEQSSVTSSQQQQQQQLLLTSKERPTGAFLPFLREQSGTTQTTTIAAAAAAATPMTVTRPIPRTGSGAGLSLSFGSEPALASPSTTLKTADSEVGTSPVDAGNNQQSTMPTLSSKETPPAGGGACNGVVSGAGSSSGGQSQRKARRCWSPELHRRFVSALHQLGGCQSMFILDSYLSNLISVDSSNEVAN